MIERHTDDEENLDFGDFQDEFKPSAEKYQRDSKILTEILLKDMIFY